MSGASYLAGIRPIPDELLVASHAVDPEPLDELLLDLAIQKRKAKVRQAREAWERDHQAEIAVEPPLGFEVVERRPSS